MFLKTVAIISTFYCISSMSPKKKLKLLKNSGKVSLRKHPTLLLAPHHFVPNGEERGEKTAWRWLFSRATRKFIGEKLLRATRGARSPNIQVVITHASHVCSQLGMNGMHRTHFDQARLDLLSLVI